MREGGRAGSLVPRLHSHTRNNNIVTFDPATLGCSCSQRLHNCYDAAGESLGMRLGSRGERRRNQREKLVTVSVCTFPAEGTQVQLLPAVWYPQQTTVQVGLDFCLSACLSVHPSVSLSTDPKYT